MIKNNNNNSHHNSNQDTSLINSVFFNTQMQMLCSMIVQIKKKDCVKNCVKTVNFTSQHLKTADLSHHFEQSYSDQQNLSWCHQYKSDSNNPDDFNESVLNLLNAFCKCCQTDENTCFCSEEMSFFNPHLDAKDYESNDIINVDEKIYFCDVHLFIDSFENIVHIKTDEVICHNLNKCLCDITQNWYIDQLLVIEHEYIWEDHRIEWWEEMLFQQFKWTQSNAMKTLEVKHYTIQNIQNNHESSEFVLNVIWHAKNAEMINVSAQLTWIWNCLNISFHKSICCFTDVIMILLFIEDIKNMKKIWFNKYNHHIKFIRQSAQSIQLQQCCS